MFIDNIGIYLYIYIKIKLLVILFQYKSDRAISIMLNVNFLYWLHAIPTEINEIMSSIYHGHF